jgi:hypothetical protein
MPRYQQIIANKVIPNNSYGNDINRLCMNMMAKEKCRIIPVEDALVSYYMWNPAE